MLRLSIAIAALVLAGCSSGPVESGTPAGHASSPPSTAGSTIAPGPSDAAPTEGTAASPSDEVPVDSSTPGPCPSSPMTAEALMAAYGSCYDAGTIRVSGWLAPPEGVGGTTNGISPAWLGEWATTLVIWASPPTSAFCDTPSCLFEFIHVEPGTGPDLGSPDRWVEITGHYGDPASSTCHFTGADLNEIGDAAAYCRTMFVATEIRDIPAPH